MSSTRRLVQMAVFAAASLVLMLTIQFPIFPAAPYLKYDPADVPSLIGAFWLGPVAGLAITAVKAFLYLFLKGTDGPIGAAMNFAACGTFAFVAALIYRRFHSRMGALAGLFAGTVAMTLIMIPINYYVGLPLWGIPAPGRMPLILSTITPFNLIKGLISSVLTMLIYKPIKGMMERVGFSRFQQG